MAGRRDVVGWQINMGVSSARASKRRRAQQPENFSRHQLTRPFSVLEGSLPDYLSDTRISTTEVSSTFASSSSHAGLPVGQCSMTGPVTVVFQPRG